MKYIITESKLDETITNYLDNLFDIDDINWTNYAEKYIDLVAFSIVTDSMDIRTFENRQLLNMGFSKI